jgi:hypothetical protein
MAGHPLGHRTKDVVLVGWYRCRTFPEMATAATVYQLSILFLFYRAVDAHLLPFPQQQLLRSRILREDEISALAVSLRSLLQTQPRR